MVDLNVKILSYKFPSAYLDVVAGGVHKHTTVIPGTRLHAVGLGDGTQALQLAVTDENGVFGEQCHRGHVARPHHVAALGNASCS